jgi:hypothetical protein
MRLKVGKANGGVTCDSDNMTTNEMLGGFEGFGKERIPSVYEIVCIQGCGLSTVQGGVIGFDAIAKRSSAGLPIPTICHQTNAVDRIDNFISVCA